MSAIHSSPYALIDGQAVETLSHQLGSDGTVLGVVGTRPVEEKDDRGRRTGRRVEFAVDSDAVGGPE
jgi:hypothetical protein